MRVYAEDETVLVQWSDRGPLVTLTESGEVGERFAEPSPGDERVDLNGDVVKEAIEAARAEGYDEGWASGSEHIHDRVMAALRSAAI